MIIYFGYQGVRVIWADANPTRSIEARAGTGTVITSSGACAYQLGDGHCVSEPAPALAIEARADTGTVTGSSIACAYQLGGGHCVSEPAPAVQRGRVSR